MLGGDRPPSLRRTLTMVELILGGARSGKSGLAMTLASRCGWPVTFIATARAGDVEMAERIQRHRQERPAHWRVVEEPIHLAAQLQELDQPGHFILVDCLTLWLLNLLTMDDPKGFSVQRRALLDCLPMVRGRVVLIGNEIGMGVVPMGSLTRRFVDESGRLHQDLAVLVQRVSLVVAGLPLVLQSSTDSRPSVIDQWLVS